MKYGGGLRMREEGLWRAEGGGLMMKGDGRMTMTKKEERGRRVAEG